MKSATKTRAKKPTAATTATMKPGSALSQLVGDIQTEQRCRAIVIKSRNMQANRLQSIVAGTLGYRSGLDEKERTKLFVEAGRLIKNIVAGKASAGAHLDDVVCTTMQGVSGFNKLIQQYQLSLTKLAKQLPVAPWVLQPEQRGFGLLGLAITIGETGDLAKYANPGKVWRRMGCAPWTYDGQTLMGATWRFGKEGSLPAEEWHQFGYSPRRRSIAFIFGECLIKQNFVTRGPVDSEEYVPGILEEPPPDLLGEPDRDAEDWDEETIETEASSVPSSASGPYRRRYLDAKVRAFETHPEWKWKPCDKCKGKSGLDCGTCGGTGQKCLRAHRHGMLLATKLLLRNLWMQWNPSLVREMPWNK